MGLLEYLGLTRTETETQQVEGIRQIACQLEEMDPEDAGYLAAFACLLSRVAQADFRVTEVESSEMERLIGSKGHLPADRAAMIVSIAKRRSELFGHVENFLVTREFNALASRAQKLEVLDCLFALAAADGSVSMREDREIRQIASELLLDHREFIGIRSRYRDALAVLNLEKPE